MYIVLQRGYPDGIPINENTSVATGIREGTVVVFRPYFMLHCVDGSFVPYVATQSDLLSEVWQVIHGDGTQDAYGVAPTPGAAYGGSTGGEPISIDDLEPPFVTGKFEGPAGDQVHAEITVTRQQGYCKDE
jgi:hypothetical protein